MADQDPKTDGATGGATQGETDTDEAEPSSVAVATLSDEAAALLSQLEAELGDAIVEHAPCGDDLVVRVRTDAWRTSAQVCRDVLACDYLSFVSGIDWMPRPAEPVTGDDAGGDTSAPVQPTDVAYGAAGSAGRFQVFARVSSTSKHWGVTLKSDLDERAPSIASWVPVYPGADWHERECWEMFGFAFDGHPGLRHLYLPSDFEGHPLRKDFPLLAREVKPWPGLVDVEDMLSESDPDTPDDGEATDAAGGSDD